MDAEPSEVDALRERVRRLEIIERGYDKAFALMLAGMESQCELMDDLKQRCRKAEARVAELGGADGR